MTVGRGPASAADGQGGACAQGGPALGGDRHGERPGRGEACGCLQNLEGKLQQFATNGVMPLPLAPLQPIQNSLREHREAVLYASEPPCTGLACRSGACLS